MTACIKKLKTLRFMSLNAVLTEESDLFRICHCCTVFENINNEVSKGIS